MKNLAEHKDKIDNARLAQENFELKQLLKQLLKK